MLRDLSLLDGAHVQFLGRLLGFAPLLSLRRDAIYLVVREFALAQDLDFRKARAAEVAPGFARQEFLAGDDLADLVVRVTHLLYVIGLELPFEEILLEPLAARVLKAALHARPHVFVFRVNNRAGREDGRFPELHEPVGVVLEEAHEIAQMADPQAQIPLELLAHRLLKLVHLAGECRGLRLRAAGRRSRRTLNLCRLAHHRVITELPNLVFVERPAAEFLLAVHLFIEIGEDPHRPEAARRARLDGHEQLLQRLARCDVFDGCGVLGDLRQSLRLRQVHIRDHEPVDGMDSVLRPEADLLNGFDGPVRCLCAHTMRLGEGGHRQAHLVGVGGVLRRTERPLLGPVQRLFDRVREEVAGGRTLDHADGESVDPGRRVTRGLPRRLLHAGQAGVDALDRSVRLVDVHLDDEFEPIVVGHGEEELMCRLARRCATMTV